MYGFFVKDRHIAKIMSCNHVTFRKKAVELPSFSRYVVVQSDSLRPHGLQHARLACPSLSHYFLSQIHVHCANDAIQPSHPLLPPSPPALNSSYAILILFKLD